MASALGQPHRTTATGTITIPLVQLSRTRSVSSLPIVFGKQKKTGLSKSSSSEYYGRRNLIMKLVGKSPPGKEDITPTPDPADDPEAGVSLGTMKLPSNTDLPRFESLLFQVILRLSIYTNVILCFQQSCPFILTLYTLQILYNQQSWNSSVG